MPPALSRFLFVPVTGPFVFLDDGFFPVLSPEITSRNRKRCRVVVDRLRGKGPAIGSPLSADWVGFTAEESEMLKGMLSADMPRNYCMMHC